MAQGIATLPGDARIDCPSGQFVYYLGGGYTLNIRGTGATVPKNTRVINNRLVHDAAYEPWATDDPAPTVTGNVYDDETPISYP